MKRLAVALTALTLFAGASGCVSMGTNYDPVAVSQIAPGTPMAEVIARLGEPNSRTTLPDGGTHLMWLHSTGTAWGTADSRAAVLSFDRQGRFVQVVTTNQTRIN
ncbi:MAG: hypothetical protein Q8S03_00370 [Brevundimonas sp.]|uniref:hypothetical protein n=1 Tax=Brevundimonas sp. TaxID=1871086 RepID=UPI0027333211|nr:hypothetical protein [Brevundimonas sp.]MDP3403106.1 hypothetical protein [Brevundimonas sp.]